MYYLRIDALVTEHVLTKWDCWIVLRSNVSSFWVAEIDSYFTKYFYIRLLFEFGIQFLRKIIVLNILLEQLNRYFCKKRFFACTGTRTHNLPSSIYLPGNRLPYPDLHISGGSLSLSSGHWLLKDLAGVTRTTILVSSCLNQSTYGYQIGGQRLHHQLPWPPRWIPPFKDTSDLQCVGLGLKAESVQAFTWSFHWTSK